jgi:CRISPR/Cas system-associated exonuclease Cas4 (RecB family)
LIAGSIVLVGGAFLLDGNIQGGEKKEITIKLIMQKAHAGKNSLLSKVIKGEASEEEKKKLVEYYTKMEKLVPVKGDEEAWKKTTHLLLEAAKGNDAEALKKASNCAGCHSVFKGKK